jgi:galactosylceramidase
MMVKVLISIYSLWLLCVYAADLSLDGSKLGRKFDGIGGLSGGGATSRFLPSYPEPYKSQIMDYLFTPNFGAALQICKVEIGGDCQTTEGTESSHMHSRNDLNFNRGYEWWIMVEAKKRNPDVLLYGLSWGAPGWIGNGNFFTQDNIEYHINWLKGAKSVYNLDVDYIGVWNERSYNADWIINLRKGLDAAGFPNTKIVAADAGWDIANAMVANETLKKAIGVVGAHYPGTTSTSNATAVGTPLWASEDYSTFADSTGGGCWGRILNQNYVNGHMTSTISWNLVAAYYDALPYGGDGLMWANNPWSGHYDVQSPVWVSAHTTQFTKPGWMYLAHGSGVGKLPSGGSYVTLIPPGDNKNGDFSLIVETFTHDHSICIRPGLPAYTVTPQNVTFILTGGLAATKPLYVWKTHLLQNEANTYFMQLPSITPQNGRFSLELDLDSVVTVSTLNGRKGSHPPPPAATRFPDTYSDDFEKYAFDSEADYFMDQTGVFEIYKSGTKVMRQVVLQKPIAWCGESSDPISVIGDYDTGDQSITVDTMIEINGSSIIGLRVRQGGCGNSYAAGYFFNISHTGSWTLQAGGTVLDKGMTTFSAAQWYSISISANGSNICARVAGKQLSCVTNTEFKSGFVSIGSTWNYVQFDNFKLTAKPFTCGAGDYIKLDLCDANAANQKWTTPADGTIRLKSDNTKCLTVFGKDPGSGQPAVRLMTCAGQKQEDITWKLTNNQIVGASGSCVDVTYQLTSQCANVETYSCNGQSNQSWKYNSESGLFQLGSAVSMCLAATA